MDDDEFWNESKIASFSFDEDDKVSCVKKMHYWQYLLATVSVYILEIRNKT